MPTRRPVIRNDLDGVEIFQAAPSVDPPRDLARSGGERVLDREARFADVAQAALRIAFETTAKQPRTPAEGSAGSLVKSISCFSTAAIVSRRSRRRTAAGRSSIS